MFFLELPFLVRHTYFRKEGEGGVIYSGLKNFTDPVLILRSLGPLDSRAKICLVIRFSGAHGSIVFLLSSSTYLTWGATMS
ncbi:hypothetical protein K443DRAFT_274273 [Laccaria amethystina LaAM-08-1]|uniref:Uncharacterized protein n=1 Tax=Laccaria amethystina LaAM-08-1 TaxID=1095629 RepID=A0A0C9WVY6_9AGAR|nr:hypothetical protein K443DRAFT_274273 [Laccaria amethystina LaAM-08-1]